MITLPYDDRRPVFSGFLTGMLVFGPLVWVTLGMQVGGTFSRQSTVPIACEPNAAGLVINGKEVPLTSAQRDSLARGR